jgi:hypothetical protein
MVIFVMVLLVILLLLVGYGLYLHIQDTKVAIRKKELAEVILSYYVNMFGKYYFRYNNEKDGNANIKVNLYNALIYMRKDRSITDTAYKQMFETISNMEVGKKLSP